MSLPTTPPSLAPPQLVCVEGGKWRSRHNLRFIPQIRRHLRLSQVKFSLLQCPRVPLSAGAGVSLWPIFITDPHPDIYERPSPSPPSQHSAPPSLNTRKHLKPNSQVTWPERWPCLQGSPGAASRPVPKAERAQAVTWVPGAAWASSPASRALGQPPVSGPWKRLLLRTASVLVAPWAGTGSSSRGSSAALPGFSTRAWKDTQKWGYWASGARPRSGRWAFRGGTPWDSVYLCGAPRPLLPPPLLVLLLLNSGRCVWRWLGPGLQWCRSSAPRRFRKRRWRRPSYPPARLGWPERRLGAVPPLALPPPHSRAVSEELRLWEKGFAWGCWSLRGWRLSRHAEGRTQGLGHLEHSSAWTKNGRVWATLGVRGRPRCGHVAGRHARLAHEAWETSWVETWGVLASWSGQGWGHREPPI